MIEERTRETIECPTSRICSDGLPEYQYDQSEV